MWLADERELTIEETKEVGIGDVVDYLDILAITKVNLVNNVP